MMSLKKITDAERNNVCVTGLPDVPGLSTREMQQRIDGLGNLAIDRLNELIDVVNNGKIETNIKDPETGTLLNINHALTLIRAEVSEIVQQVEELTTLKNEVSDITQTINVLQEELRNKIVSVTELPSEPVEGTVYIVQGEVTVE